MSDVSEALNRVFKETSEFIVLGLTGRTGSECSTAATILASPDANLPEVSNIYSSDNDKLKFKIIRNYIQKNWKPFICIQIRTVITAIILELDFEELKQFISETLKKDLNYISSRFSDFENEYSNAHAFVSEYKRLPDDTREKKEQKKALAWEVYFEFLPGFCEKFKAALQDYLGQDSYTVIYQKAGDNIRASGVANKEKFDANRIFTLPSITNQLIKVIRSRQPQGAFITIDAIRNPFEAVYFHQRYSGFYLISINTPNQERLEHLRRTHKLSEPQIKAMDDKEYPRKLAGKDIFVSQNIQKCIELSDIHINNPDRKQFNNNELKSQLLWYVSLILHPGLIPPTSIERCMQLAYSAKLNSGCISRQVGAVVTDLNYSVKAVGWNSTPQGQTPCILRNADELLTGGSEPVYSVYEREDEDFHHVLESTYQGISRRNQLDGRNLSYCFKDLQNEVDGEKNQVHTRSLHAEENAFLQITKYGGEPLKGGILFSTASPCELCSKKAYQLGINTVVYIDPYPGISKEHILESGTNIPSLILFRGAIGRAYHRLYQPLMGYKDELEMLTGITITGGKKRNKKEIRLKALESENKTLKDRIKELETRHDKVN